MSGFTALAKPGPSALDGFEVRCSGKGSTSSRASARSAGETASSLQAPDGHAIHRLGRREKPTIGGDIVERDEHGSSAIDTRRGFKSPLVANAVTPK